MSGKKGPEFRLELILGLDLHENTGRNNQAVQGIDGAGGVIVDVDHPLVGAHLELLAGLLVGVRGVRGGVAVMSFAVLWVRFSDVARYFLSMGGLRRTVYRSTRVGIGIGPQTR